MAKAKAPSKNQAVLDELLSDEFLVVESGAGSFHLTEPSRAQVTQLALWAEENKPSGRAEEVERGLTLQLKALRCCLPELTSDDMAWRVLTRSGGVGSPLAVRCMEVCGLNVASLEDAVEADPTRS